ncbi:MULTISPECIES: hypothetical protein [Staphylococcus]|uniref:hypothetical protein n=1 Tax=Staphylococcus TaxID=1279 RepID=UPI0011CC411C|nr:hypothetical protein [Staphylococcus nepalensis]
MSKIKQIIPAPNNLYALYEDDEHGIDVEGKILCLGIVTDNDGIDYVTGFEADELGFIEDVSETLNFKGYTYK